MLTLLGSPNRSSFPVLAVPTRHQYFCPKPSVQVSSDWSPLGKLQYLCRNLTTAVLAVFMIRKVWYGAFGRRASIFLFFLPQYLPTQQLRDWDSSLSEINDWNLHEEAERLRLYEIEKNTVTLRHGISPLDYAKIRRHFLGRLTLFYKRLHLFCVILKRKGRK